MASKVRGNRQTTLTQEQLQTLGCIGKDIPAVPTAPPSTFPPLLSRPAPLENTTSSNYQVLWKEEFSNYMRDSPYFLIPKLNKSNIQSYSDQCIKIFWNLMPTELKPTWEKKKIASSQKTNKNIETLVAKLKTLEEKEKDESNPDDEHTDTDNEDDVEKDQDQEEDDEMDEENDYGNNYFDNGEAFNDEDDNLDEGPIY